jgi:NADH-quinone oxidoreductase subunit K
MNMINGYLAVGAILFSLGAVGFLTRRNLILMILSGEMMLHGVSLTLTTFSKLHGNNEGQVFTIFILTVAACEAGLALALILALYQKGRTLDIDLWSVFHEPDLPSPTAGEIFDATPGETDYPNLPRLTPAGLPPEFQRGDRKETTTNV